MVRQVSTIDASQWLSSAIALAKQPTTSLATIQERVDFMTDPLSEAGHQLAREASDVAMQINRFRSMGGPLPQWTPEQQANPEKTLRQLAIAVFRQVERDEIALGALQASGELYL